MLKGSSTGPIYAYQFIIHWSKEQTDFGIVECESLCQVYDMGINIDVVEDIRNKSALLAKLGIIIEPFATFF